MITFPWVRCMFICVLLARVCNVYVVKEFALFRGGSFNQWAWRVIGCALKLYRPAGSNLLVALHRN